MKNDTKPGFGAFLFAFIVTFASYVGVYWAISVWLGANSAIVYSSMVVFFMLGRSLYRGIE